MRLLVDADQMVYACGFATEGEPLSHATHLVDKQIESIIKKLPTTDVDVYIGGPDNFRVDVDDEYKAHRPSRKPSHYEGLRFHLRDRWDAEVVMGMEADDRVSIELYQDLEKAEFSQSRTSVICVSPDKDLNNTPGWHYNPQKERYYWVTPRQARRHLAFQMLAGDSVDNIKGLTGLPKALCDLKGWHPKCGKVTAKKIMQEFKSGNDAVALVHALYHLSLPNPRLAEEEYNRNLKLLWMCRAEEEADPDYKIVIHNSRRSKEIYKSYVREIKVS